MATRTKPQFEALYGTSASVFADNTTGDISAGDMRAFGQDIADSVFTTGLITSKVTIPSASILIGNATPVTLIAAQGAGTIIEVISLTIFLDYNSAAYATNTTLRISYDTSVIIYSTPNVLNQTADTYLSHGISPFTPTTTNISNKAIFFDVQTGNPTAGNSPLYVYLTYRVITL